MSAQAISAGSLRLPGRGGAASGTPAEQAVQRAQKAYAQAVERLRTDALQRADAQVMKIDQAAVDFAGGALAQAQAALVREQRQTEAASQARTPRTPRASEPDAQHLAQPVADSVELTTRPRAEDARHEHGAHRDRQRLDDALTAVLSVNTLA